MMFIVVMAGGAGTRFWPASRRAIPKQFLNISGRSPMVVETCDRLGPLAGDEEMVLVLGREHLVQAKGLFKGRKVHCLAEPVGRNTAPCMGFGAIYAEYQGHAGPAVFLPADHFIGDPDAFLAGLRRAEEVARSGAIVTLGITPTRPETGYGYIQRGEEPSGSGDLPAYRVAAFVEKPDLEKARQYLARGNYYWNGGIFVATPTSILEAFEKYLPDLHKGLMRIRAALGTGDFETTLESVYGDIEGVSFDYGIMERTADPVYVVPCECGWSDVGSWESLYRLKEDAHDGEGNLSEGESLLVDCLETFVSSRGGRTVACLGLRKCLVVDTPEALLVADLNRSQDVRMIMDQLKKSRKDDLL